MAQTRRAQILMEPEEYRQLEKVALRRHTSVAELFRSAVRQVYLSSTPDKARALENLAALSLEVPDWSEVEKDLAEAHDVCLH